MIVNSTGTLLKVANNISKGGVARMMQNQVLRIQDRLNRGVDIHGMPFAPYKYPKYARQSRPLLRAARLFEPSTIDVSSSGSVTRATISIFGRAARIARWQNRLRRFYGYSTEDRKEMLRDALEEARRAKQA